MARFYVDKEMIYDDVAIITDDEDIYHFHKVLRARKGDPVEISDGVEYEYSCTVKKMTRKEITLEIVDRKEFDTEPELKVTLY